MLAQTFPSNAMAMTSLLCSTSVELFDRQVAPLAVYFPEVDEAATFVLIAMSLISDVLAATAYTSTPVIWAMCLCLS